MMGIVLKLTPGCYFSCTLLYSCAQGFQLSVQQHLYFGHSLETHGLNWWIMNKWQGAGTR